MKLSVATFARSYVRPDLDATVRESHALARAVETASGPDAVLDRIRDWNKLRSTLDTHRQIASVRYHQDTRDPDIRAEHDFWNNASPTLRELDALHARTLLATHHHGAIDKAFGPQFLALLRCAAAVFAPEMKDSIRDEARATARYTEIMADPTVIYRGRSMNLTGVGKYISDPDRATRLEAQIARDSFLQKHGDELDALYDQLVKLRHGMARTLGHADFKPLGYQLLSRTGYGPLEVARFRDEIRREVVPLAMELQKAQARRLGLDQLLFHDEPVGDARGNPVPLGDAEFCMEQAHTMFHQFDPELAAFVDLMMSNGLFDLVNRDGKAGGGFCTCFWDLGLPFVFANFNGTEADIITFVHECGHAFAAYQTRNAPLLEYRFPTLEACEVHSFGMEYLTGPWMGLFFGDQEADRLRRSHLESRVTGLPYMAAIDHFQDEVYSRPHLSPRERRALWREVEQMYLPHRVYPKELPYLASGALWQRQLHVYMHPFYYIDYALAQSCALQLWHRARHDRKAAVRDYHTLCATGGRVGFEEMVRRGGLRSPFEPGCLKEIVAEANAELR